MRWRPGSAQTHWGSYSAPQDPLAVIRVREDGKRKGERIGKGNGGLYLDICPRAPEFLVTPLVNVEPRKIDWTAQSRA